ncbi:uncharacterized protein GLRG_02322 [Colletotrichum graminicola M1.001]|uniref:Uncharacterized protein n=1 Tax=Colletotrichum graminicola (strain M1.001 / M2 / FGSC 10212) TaxID=645133 RepID=E3Q8D9_COLGM|nr:uncharacterized protein GLRG_02322 [Colletotrichum graminicola M1.001]EFQ27151.1 hypothetical protein GLRG_02322 [Colletotrichum graminicola M1.001]
MQAVAATRTINGRPTSRPPNARSVRSPDSELLWIALSRPKPFPHEARQPDPIHRHWEPTRRPGKGYSGNDRSLLGVNVSEDDVWFAGKDGFLLIYGARGCAGAEALRSGRTQPEGAGSHYPVIAWGGPQPAGLCQASGAHPYRGIGGP